MLLFLKEEKYKEKEREGEGKNKKKEGKGKEGIFWGKLSRATARPHFRIYGDPERRRGLRREGIRRESPYPFKKTKIRRFQRIKKGRR